MTPPSQTVVWFLLGSMQIPAFQRGRPDSLEGKHAPHPAGSAMDEETRDPHSGLLQDWQILPALPAPRSCPLCPSPGCACYTVLSRPRGGWEAEPGGDGVAHWWRDLQAVPGQAAWASFSVRSRSRKEQNEKMWRCAAWPQKEHMWHPLRENQYLGPRQ
jgi:hypothetical protein